MEPHAQAHLDIGRYRVEAMLGRGAMGIIYRAHDPVINRKVALKLVRADLLDGEDRADYIARFRQEAQAAGRCSHPNIVAIYDFALHEGNPYLAMEYIDGVTLTQVQASAGRFGVAEAVDLGSQMLDGLGAAHALGVVHRDIKPANVMLAPGGRVKVTDFGISRLDTSHLTGAGGVVGTPSYMSPEQCRGQAVDGRSDLFSASVVLYELLTGAKPFRGASQHEVWHKLLHEDPPDSATLRPEAPAALHDAIRRGLAKDPAARFADAAGMAAALRAAIHVTQGGAPAASDLDRTVMATRSKVAASPEVASPAPEAFALDSSALTTIERQLAQHVGPIAGHLLRSAVRRSDTMEALCETLASSIGDAAGRDRFQAAMKVQLAGSFARTGARSGGSGRAGAALPEADLARAQAALTRFVGPVARVLVKRAAPGCTDVNELWMRLAQHVEAAPDRATFLKAM